MKPRRHTYEHSITTFKRKRSKTMTRHIVLFTLTVGALVCLIFWARAIPQAQHLPGWGPSQTPTTVGDEPEAANPPLEPPKAPKPPERFTVVHQSDTWVGVNVITDNQTHREYIVFNTDHGLAVAPDTVSHERTQHAGTTPEAEDRH